MKSGKLFLGLLAGVAVGATLGLLFAPKKGSSIRKRISRKKDEYLNELETKFDDFIEGLTKKSGNVKEGAAHMVEAGKQKATDLATDKK